MTIWKTENTELNIDFLYTVEENTTLQIKIISGGYKGEYPFCLHISQILNIIQLCEKKSSLITINDEDSDSYLKFDFNSNEKGKIEGLIGGSYNDNYLHFSFNIDQTIYEILKKYMKSFI